MMLSKLPLPERLNNYINVFSVSLALSRHKLFVRRNHDSMRFIDRSNMMSKTRTPRTRTYEQQSPSIVDL